MRDVVLLHHVGHGAHASPKHGAACKPPVLNIHSKCDRPRRPKCMRPSRVENSLARPRRDAPRPTQGPGAGPRVCRQRAAGTAVTPTKRWRQRKPQCPPTAQNDGAAIGVRPYRLGHHIASNIIPSTGAYRAQQRALAQATRSHKRTFNAGCARNNQSGDRPATKGQTSGAPNFFQPVSDDLALSTPSHKLEPRGLWTSTSAPHNTPTHTFRNTHVAFTGGVRGAVVQLDARTARCLRHT